MKAIGTAQVGDQERGAGQKCRGRQVIAPGGSAPVVGRAEILRQRTGAIRAGRHPPEPEVRGHFPGPHRTPNDRVVVVTLAAPSLTLPRKRGREISASLILMRRGPPR